MRDGEPWYRVWFDSPYYGILYGDRDQEEADAFIRRLEGTLRAQPPATALDVACGTGRHSVVLAELGYDVLGIDLSAPSIAVAKRRTRPNLTFQVLDMRAIEWRERFDLAVNLFTSFGYFGDEDDERRVLGGIERALRPGGELVIDFLNAARTVAELVPAERIERGGIAFDITREVRDGTIVKTIEVDDPRRAGGRAATALPGARACAERRHPARLSAGRRPEPRAPLRRLCAAPLPAGHVPIG